MPNKERCPLRDLYFGHLIMTCFETFFYNPYKFVHDIVHTCTNRNGIDHCESHCDIKEPNDVSNDE